MAASLLSALSHLPPPSHVISIEEADASSRLRVSCVLYLPHVQAEASSPSPLLPVPCSPPSPPLPSTPCSYVIGIDEAEAFSERLKRELAGLEAANVYAILESESLVEQVGAPCRGGCSFAAEGARALLLAAC